jgi:hypothetical protein
VIQGKSTGSLCCVGFTQSLWYQRRVRVLAASVAAAICVAACGETPAPAPSASAMASADRHAVVNPANIARVRDELPPDYEVVDISGAAAPLMFWGFRLGWVADPTHCGVLGDPAPGGATRGWSGSGAGGIVYVVVTGSPASLDPALLTDCAEWTLSSGHTTGAVTLMNAPAIEDAQTVGMATAVKTVVEGGTATQSHADTFTAYLGEHVASVTVVTDPGSPGPALGRDFAAALLVKTVSALRG